MEIRNRIKKMVQLEPSQIVENPKNWRTHPKHQQDALRGMLNDVGIVDVCIVRPIADGKFMLIDGHLRAKTIQGQKIPAVIVDLTEEEADKILMTLDPLAAMAGTSPADLKALVDTVKLGADTESLMANLKDSIAKFRIDEIAKGKPIDTGRKTPIPPDYGSETKLDEDVKEVQLGDETPLLPKTDEGEKIPNPGDMYRPMSMQLTIGQHSTILKAIKLAKEKFSVETTPEAIARICDGFLSQ